MIETGKNRALTCWVVTDGRAGIEAQALGLAEAISARRPATIMTKRIAVNAPWRKLPRFFWGDPFSKLAASSDALQPPFPDLWIGCGRLSVPFSIAAKKKNPSSFVVQLQNPHAPSGLFDLVIAPEHDGLAGANVFSITGSTMRSRSFPARANDQKHVAALIGGPNRAFRMTRADAEKIGDQLRKLAETGARLQVTTSRRTPADAAQMLEDKLSGVAEIFWRADCGEKAANPFPGMLGGAAAILVTEDSVNMAVEAAATGAPVHILRLARKPFATALKFDAFHQSLAARGVARYFGGALERWNYTPLNETDRAAQEVLRRLA
ncbi:MAG: mitochondrial fission ELM1 family protein [Pseudomonadota bacterium]